MSIKALLSDPKAIRLEYIRSGNNKITLIVRTTCPTAACPRCNNPSARAHSKYERIVADLPWQGIAVEMQLHTRRFFCDQSLCRQRIFCERLPGVVACYARRTIRLNEALELVGFAIGGEVGARTVVELGMQVSPDTLIRRIRHASATQYSTPRVLGVDDWAFRRAKNYGTILVDLEKRRIIDLLPARESETLSQWLIEHPGVEIIARDRSGSYAEGARCGAPTAIQVVDRWHLLKNLGETVERFLTNHSQYLRAAASMVANRDLNNPALVDSVDQTNLLSSRNNQQRQRSRQKRYARYCEVIKLHNQGVSVLGIARRLKISRMTVYKYIQAEVFPERVATPSRGSSLTRYLPYINSRLAEGCQNASQILREIVARGYRGKGKMLRRYIGRLRERLSISDNAEERIKLLNAQAGFRTPSSKRAMWWLINKAEDQKEVEKLFVEQLCQLYPVTATVQELAHRFQNIIRKREEAQFEQWLELVEQSGIAEFKGFADALKKEKAAVMAALKYQWSTSPVEGHINKLKMIKRQMFGRAKFDLLKARVLKY